MVCKIERIAIMQIDSKSSLNSSPVFLPNQLRFISTLVGIWLNTDNTLIWQFGKAIIRK
jgi:hypothetical protein